RARAAGARASERPAATAAHQLSLELAGLAFMVPLGIASAAAVRVGHAVGRGDRPGAGGGGWGGVAGGARGGWAGTALGGAAMSPTAVAFLLLPRILIGAFTRDAEVIRTGTVLLGV